MRWSMSDVNSSKILLPSPAQAGVVGVLLKAPLVPLELSQTTFSRLRCDLLERLPPTCIPLAAAFNQLAAKGFAVAVGCHSDDAQVNPKCSVNIEELGFVYV